MMQHGGIRHTRRLGHIRQAQRLRPLFHEQRLRRRKDIGARFLRRATDSG